MYQINLPREFVHPPLYLMRHESQPKVLAKRIVGKRGALRFRPTLRQDVQIGQRIRPPVSAAIAPVAAAAISPARVIAGRPVARVRPSAPATRQPMAMPRRAVKAGEPVVQMYRYAPAGGFMRAFARSGNKALSVRPKGVVEFRPHPRGRAKVL